MGDAGREGRAKGRRRPSSDELERSMDQLSLEQALADAELANSRVIELTRQLVEARQKIAGLEGPGPVVRALTSLRHRIVAMLRGSPLEAWARRLRAKLGR